MSAPRLPSGRLYLPQQEAGAEFVVVLEDEMVIAAAVRRALHLRDDPRSAADIDVAEDAASKLIADDAEVPQRVAARQLARGVAKREPRRRSTPARRAVDLAVGEDGHVALHVRLLALEEDDAVEIAQLGFERVNDVVLRLELRLQLATQLDQARQLARLDP